MLLLIHGLLTHASIHSWPADKDLLTHGLMSHDSTYYNLSSSADKSATLCFYCQNNKLFLLYAILKDTFIINLVKRSYSQTVCSLLALSVTVQR